VKPERFHRIAERYPNLRIAVLGDFCLDRYLEIDPLKQEISIETGLPVHNVVNVRPQPGGAGTILNNLCALGIGTIYPIGFAGADGEGFELWNALEKLPNVQMKYFIQTPDRRTFTYCKPLVIEPNKPPLELNRLDSKNWTRTPAGLEGLLKENVLAAASLVDALIILDQVDLPETGVVTQGLLSEVHGVTRKHRELIVLADSRRGLRGYPPLMFKMNAAELGSLTGAKGKLDQAQIREKATELAQKNSHNVFVTLAEGGIFGALPTGEVQHIPALPLRGEIDIVGAGDAVSANLTAAMAAGASLNDALELGNAAASIVIHKLGTTGTATVAELAELLVNAGRR